MEPGQRPHDGAHDGIYIRMGSYYFKSILRLKDLRLKPILLQLLRQLLSMGRTGHHGKLRLELGALVEHQVHLRGCAQRKDFILIGVASHHIQGIGSYGTGRTQNRDFLLHGCTKDESIIASGSVGRRASMRSRTPPWPGSKPLLS